MTTLWETYLPALWKGESEAGDRLGMRAASLTELLAKWLSVKAALQGRSAATAECMEQVVVLLAEWEIRRIRLAGLHEAHEAEKEADAIADQMVALLDIYEEEIAGVEPVPATDFAAPEPAPLVAIPPSQGGLWWLTAFWPFHAFVFTVTALLATIALLTIFAPHAHAQQTCDGFGNCYGDGSKDTGPYYPRRSPYEGPGFYWGEQAPPVAPSYGDGTEPLQPPPACAHFGNGGWTCD